MPKKNNPGGCKCCCPASICVSANGCATGPIPGAAVTVSQGGTTVGTCTTDAAGKCCVQVPGYNTSPYTVQCNTPGGLSQTQTVTFPSGSNCPNASVNFGFIDRSCVTVNGCNGPVSGANVSGAFSCTTSGSGSCCFTWTTNPPAGGTVTVKKSNQQCSQTGPIQCAYSFQIIDQVCIKVFSCGATNSQDGFLPLPGATVTITSANGTVGTGTTDANGVFCCVPAVNISCGAVSSLSYTVTAPRYTTATGTVGVGCNLGQVFMSPAAGYVCCPNCVVPVAKTLTLTTPSGSYAFTSTSRAAWFWCTIETTTVVTGDPFAGTCVCSSGLTPVCWHLACSTDYLGRPVWTLSQDWKTAFCYDPGTLAPPPCNFTNFHITCTGSAVKSGFHDCPPASNNECDAGTVAPIGEAGSVILNPCSAPYTLSFTFPATITGTLWCQTLTWPVPASGGIQVTE